MIVVGNISIQKQNKKESLKLSFLTLWFKIF
jgi:hypothetical protein